jgi:D-threo-aldose 1-dehydrogenase
MRSLEQSLDRLGLDRVDLVYLHDPDEHWDDALRHAYPALEELRSEGVVSGIGAGMNQVEMLVEFTRRTNMDTLMLAGRYTLLDRSALTELLPLCEQRGVGVVVAGVFNSGLLAHANPSTGGRFDYREAPVDVVERACRIAEVCAVHGTSLPAAAIAFVLEHPAVLSACIGARSADQVVRNVDLYEDGVPRALWPALRADGLL